MNRLPPEADASSWIPSTGKTKPLVFGGDLEVRLAQGSDSLEYDEKTDLTQDCFGKFATVPASAQLVTNGINQRYRFRSW